MELTEAQELTKLSSIEHSSIQRYLGFQHTGINILANLTPFTYQNLSQKGWYLPQNEEDLKQAIEDFVNLYSAMYKESKNSGTRRSLIRGTSNTQANHLHGSTEQFLSTTTDEGIAKTFCEYNNAALVRINIASDVPFLNAYEYRSENLADEKEVIIAPFCKISKSEYAGHFGEYSRYTINLEKQELEGKTQEEIDGLSSDVLTNFVQNISDMKEFVHLTEFIEILQGRYQRAKGDREEQRYISQSMDDTYKKIDEYRHKTYGFASKLKGLLMGLCKQKELEIDKAYELVEQDRQKRKEEAERKKAEEQALKEAQEKEEARQTLFSELSSNLEKAPHRAIMLENVINQTYKDFISAENAVKKAAERMGVPYTPFSMNTNIQEQISKIQENIKNILTQTASISIDENASQEELSNLSKQVTPLLDGLSFGLEISKDFSELTNSHRDQVENQFKRNIYQQVHTIMHKAKIQKCTEQKDRLSQEKVGLFGKLTGKQHLKEAKLKNLELQIAQAQIPVVPQNPEYHIRDILADMYVYSITELDGNFSPKMTSLYQSIQATFEDVNSGRFSEEYIKQLASKKIAAKSKGGLPALPDRKPRFFGKTNYEIKFLQAENEALQTKISDAKSTSFAQQTIAPQSDTVSQFQEKLKGIYSSTLEKQAEQKDLEDTLELFPNT